MNIQPLLTPLKARILWLGKERAQSVTEFAILGSLIIMAFAFLISYSEKLNRQQAYIQQTFRAALQEAKAANNSASYTKVVFNRMPNVSNPMELGQLQSFSSSANILWGDGKGSRQEFGEDADGNMRYKDVLGPVKYQLNEDAAITIDQPETLHNLTLDLEDAGKAITDPALKESWGEKITGLKDIQTALGEDAPDYPKQAENLRKIISELPAWVDDKIITGLETIRVSLIGGKPEVSENTFTNIVDSTTTLEKQKILGAGITTTKTLDAEDTLTAAVTIGTSKQTFTHYLGEKGKYYPNQEKPLYRSRSMQ